MSGALLRCSPDATGSGTGTSQPCSGGAHRRAVLLTPWPARGFTWAMAESINRQWTSDMPIHALKTADLTSPPCSIDAFMSCRRRCPTGVGVAISPMPPNGPVRPWHGTHEALPWLRRTDGSRMGRLPAFESPRPEFCTQNCPSVAGQGPCKTKIAIAAAELLAFTTDLCLRS